MDKKKAAATALATTIAASGAAVDATFDSPQDILQNTYVEPVVDYVTPDGTIDDDGTTQDDEDKGKQAVTVQRRRSGSGFWDCLLRCAISSWSRCGSSATWCSGRAVSS